MFCALRFRPMRLRIRVQLSSAKSSNSRRLDAPMSCSVKVAVHRYPMDIGGSVSILFCTKQSISSMMTPLLLTVLLLFNVPVAWVGLVAELFFASRLLWSAHARPSDAALFKSSHSWHRRSSHMRRDTSVRLQSHCQHFSLRPIFTQALGDNWTVRVCKYTQTNL